MKVLHCITGLSGDGAQRMLLRAAQGLAPLGVENTIVSLRSDGELAHAFRASGFEVEVLAMERANSIVPALMKLRRLIRVHRPDIIQGWMYHANVLAVLVRGLAGSHAPVCWNVRRGLDDLGERKLATQSLIRASAWLSRRAAHIIYCSHPSRDQHTRIGFCEERTSVLGNGFDTEVFAPSEQWRTEMRRAFGFHRSDFVIGTFGRYDVAKGHRYLIRAFAQIAEEVPHLQLLCVGRGIREKHPDLSLDEYSSHVRSRIRFESERDDMNRLYSALDVYCSPSIAEGFPNVIGEAAASGLPILATDTGASAELMGSSGVLVRPRSVSELTRGLLQLVGEDAETRRARGERARRTIVGAYSLGAIVRAYKHLYDELLTPFEGLGPSATR